MPLIPLALSLAQFAPSLLRFFGAGEKPVAIAQQVIDIAQSVTGTKSPEEALAAMQKNQEFAQKFQMAVLQQDGEFERMYLDDRKDARSRDVALAQATGHTNRRADIMLTLAFLAVIVISCLLALGTVTPSSAVSGFLFTIGGMFARNIGTAFDFEFGSSRGSKDKDDLLSKLASKGAA